MLIVQKCSQISNSSRELDHATTCDIDTNGSEEYHSSKRK